MALVPAEPRLLKSKVIKKTSADHDFFCSHRDFAADAGQRAAACQEFQDLASAVIAAHAEPHHAGVLASASVTVTIAAVDRRLAAAGGAQFHARLR